jgi:uncharacterized protein DUF6065
MTDDLTGAAVQWYRAIPEARDPMRADKSAAGALLTKAYRFCEPARAASGWGWYVFPPCDLTLLWDGETEIRWAWNGHPVGVLDGTTVDAAQWPDFAGYFDGHAPAECRGYAWPLVSALQEPGLVQIWTGWLARTAPDWSLNVRPVVNRPRAPGYELAEGILETDRWFGGLFANVRLTRTHAPIRIRRAVPLFQAQPIPRAVYQAQSAPQEVRNLPDWDWVDWARYHETVVVPHPRGHYAVTSRQRPPAALDA